MFGSGSALPTSLALLVRATLRWLFPPAHPSQPWPYSLRSHGRKVVLPPVVLHAHGGSCLTPRRLLTCGDGWNVNVKSASGGHRLRE